MDKPLHASSRACLDSGFDSLISFPETKAELVAAERRRKCLFGAYFFFALLEIEYARAIRVNQEFYFRVQTLIFLLPVLTESAVVE
jgi:hypothetical protein